MRQYQKQFSKQNIDLKAHKLYIAKQQLPDDSFQPLLYVIQKFRQRNNAQRSH